jgi:hypothetical protein
MNQLYTVKEIDGLWWVMLGANKCPGAHHRTREAAEESAARANARVEPHWLKDLATQVADVYPDKKIVVLMPGDEVPDELKPEPSSTALRPGECPCCWEIMRGKPILHRKVWRDGAGCEHAESYWECPNNGCTWAA